MTYNLRFSGFDDEWAKVKLGDIITLMQSGLSRQLSPEDIGVPVIRSNNIQNGHVDISDISYWYLKDTKGAKIENYFLKKNDLLINFINSLSQIGKNAVYNNELNRPTIFTTNIMRLNFKKEVNTYFMYYLFNTAYYKNYIDKITKPAVNQASFTTTDFKKMDLKIPDIIEQKQISEFLLLIDKKIELLEQKHNYYQDFKKYLMQQIFAQKLRFKHYDDDWKETKIGNIAEVVGGGTPKTEIDSYWNGDIKWYTPSEIGKTKYIDDSERHITEEGLKNSSAKLLPKNTILLSSRATVGEVSITLTECSTNQGFQSLITKNNVDNEFIYYLISTIKNEFLKRSSGSTFLEISRNEIKKIKINIPSLNEQKLIGNVLSDIDKKIFYLENRINKTQEFKRGLLQQMFI